MKQNLLRIYHWEYFWLVLILLVTLLLHFAIILSPDQLVFDEQHYAKDARSIITDHYDQRPEHPPLSKLFIAGGMELFGDNQYGWRFPSIIMGTIGIALFFFICKRLGMSRIAVNIATFLMAFENFYFLQAGMAMLDVFFVVLTLAFFVLYLYREYILSGIFIGLAAVAKVTAIFAAPTIFIHWVFSREKRSAWFIATIVLAPISFVAFVTLFDFAISHTFQNPLIHIKDMISLMSSLTFDNVTHPAMGRPWEWVLTYRPFTYWFGPLNEPIGPISVTNWIGGFTGAISPNVWVVMIPVLLYMLYRAIKNRSEAGLFGIAWFFSTLILLIPYSIVTNRVSFIFYVYPSIGAICLGLGMGFSELFGWLKTRSWKVKTPVIAGVSLFFTVHLGTILILTPLINFFLGKSI